MNLDVNNQSTLQFYRLKIYKLKHKYTYKMEKTQVKLSWSHMPVECVIVAISFDTRTIFRPRVYTTKMYQQTDQCGKNLSVQYKKCNKK